MYKFKEINAEYCYNSTVITPDGHCHVYKATMKISVLPNLVEGFNFTLHKAKDETINGAPLKDINYILSTIGQSIYPVELHVLADGTIKKVNNYEDIKNRCQRICQETLSTYKDSCIVEQCIDSTLKEVSNYESFFSSFLRGGFENLLFLKEATESQAIILFDFPGSVKRFETYFKLTDAQEREYTYELVSQKHNENIQNVIGSLYCCYSKKGLPVNISMRCCAEVENEGLYTKRLSLNIIEK